METVPVREINNQNEAKPLNVYMAPKSKKLNGKNQYSWRKKRINIYNTQKKNCGQNLIYWKTEVLPRDKVRISITYWRYI